MAKKVNNNNNNVVMNASKGRSSKKWLLGLLAIVPLGMILGGVAYAINMQKNNSPEKIYEKAVNSIFANNDGSYNVNLEMLDGQGSSQATISIDAVSANGITQADFNAKISVINLTGSMQTNGKDKLYVKVNELGPILNQYASGANIPADMQAKIKSLSGKWILVKPSDFEAMGASKNDLDNLQKCLTTIGESKKTLIEGVRQSLRDSRNNNAIVLPLEDVVTNETIDGEDSYKMILNIKGGVYDQTLYDAFLKEPYKTAIDKVEKDCDSTRENTVSESGLTDTNVLESPSNISGPVTVWVGKKSKELKQMSFTSNDSGASQVVTITHKKSNKTITTINDNQVVTFAQVIKDFGIDKLFNSTTINTQNSDEANLFGNGNNAAQ